MEAGAVVEVGEVGGVGLLGVAAEDEDWDREEEERLTLDTRLSRAVLPSDGGPRLRSS
jgi:hypothetical protein